MSNIAESPNIRGTLLASPNVSIKAKIYVRLHAALGKKTAFNSDVFKKSHEICKKSERL